MCSANSAIWPFIPIGISCQYYHSTTKGPHCSTMIDSPFLAQTATTNSPTFLIPSQPLKASPFPIYRRSLCFPSISAAILSIPYLSQVRYVVNASRSPSGRCMLCICCLVRLTAIYLGIVVEQDDAVSTCAGLIRKIDPPPPPHSPSPALVSIHLPCVINNMLITFPFLPSHYVDTVLNLTLKLSSSHTFCYSRLTRPQLLLPCLERTGRNSAVSTPSHPSSYTNSHSQPHGEIRPHGRGYVH